MGTFSMQTKQVSYHRGKNLLFFCFLWFRHFYLKHTVCVFLLLLHVSVCAYERGTCHVVCLCLDDGVMYVCSQSHEYCTGSALQEWAQTYMERRCKVGQKKIVILHWFIMQSPSQSVFNLGGERGNVCAHVYVFVYIYMCVCVCVCVCVWVSSCAIGDVYKRWWYLPLSAPWTTLLPVCPASVWQEETGTDTWRMHPNVTQMSIYARISSLNV